MDFTLNQQWEDNSEVKQEEDPEENIPKIPRKMSNDSPHNNNNNNTNNNNNKHLGELPLFVSQSQHHSPPPTPTLSNGGRNRFSMAQWEELEVQAVIYRHLVAGSAVPPQLLHFIHKSLLSSPYYLHHYPPPPSYLQAGYWGKGAMDPEPGRCRRTDGKKWRCSRDVVGGYKYCERHMHRGRNRSRKPVESPTSTVVASTTTASDGGIDAFQLHSRSGDNLRSDNDSTSGDGKSNNKRVLMDFFDESTRGETNGSHSSSSTSLSMSTPGNSTSDFLRLSTGNVDDVGPSDRERGQISWTGGWGGNTVASMGMGGPLAEALRSSTNSSPTSVLH